MNMLESDCLLAHTLLWVLVDRCLSFDDSALDAASAVCVETVENCSRCVPRLVACLVYPMILSLLSAPSDESWSESKVETTARGC